MKKGLVVGACFLFILIVLTSSALAGHITYDSEGWTGWLNRDGPSGRGDYETKVDFDGLCASPISIECRVEGTHVSYDQTGQVVTVAPSVGCYCLNSDNLEGCLDYEVRFLCPDEFGEEDNCRDCVNADKQWCVTGDGSAGFCQFLGAGCEGVYYLDVVDCPLELVCGDGTCNGEETCTTCPEDCGECEIPLTCVECIESGGAWCELTVGNNYCDLEAICSGAENVIITPGDCSAIECIPACEDPYVCMGGECVQQVGIPVTGCIDSDGGVNYYVNGTIKWAGQTHSDFCDGFSGKLMEWFCEEEENVMFGSIDPYECPNGCVDGACVTDGTDECIDSDVTEEYPGGKNYNVFGIVSNLLHSGKAYDTCNEGGIVSEKYCVVGYDSGAMFYTCPNGCRAGACISENSIYEPSSCEVQEFGTSCEKIYEGDIVFTTVIGIPYTFSIAAKGNDWVKLNISGEVEAGGSREDTMHRVYNEITGEGLIIFVNDVFYDGVGVVFSKSHCIDNGEQCVAFILDDEFEVNIDEASYLIKARVNNADKAYFEIGEDFLRLSEGESGIIGGLKVEVDDITYEIKLDGSIIAYVLFSLTSPKEDCTTGCYLDGKCYNIGVRKSGNYCGEGLDFEKQKKADASCGDNFGCLSNVCLDGECVKASTWQKFLKWFSRWFGGGNKKNLVADDLTFTMDDGFAFFLLDYREENLDSTDEYSTEFFIDWETGDGFSDDPVRTISRDSLSLEGVPIQISGLEIYRTSFKIRAVMDTREEIDEFSEEDNCIQKSFAIVRNEEGVIVDFGFEDAESCAEEILVVPFTTTT